MEKQNKITQALKASFFLKLFGHPPPFTPTKTLHGLRQKFRVPMLYQFGNGKAKKVFKAGRAQKNCRAPGY